MPLTLCYPLKARAATYHCFFFFFGGLLAAKEGGKNVAFIFILPDKANVAPLKGILIEFKFASDASGRMKRLNCPSFVYRTNLILK